MDLLDCAFHITRFDIYVCMKYLYNDKHSYKMYMLLSSDEIYQNITSLAHKICANGSCSAYSTKVIQYKLATEF